MKAGEHALKLRAPAGLLDAMWQVPTASVADLVFAHGAGAGYMHATMQGLADAFAEVGLASLRFNFPFMQAGKRRVDSPVIAVQTIAAATAHVRAHSDRPLILAGHSFGGRMCSQAVAQTTAAQAGLAEPLACAGLVFCSFPLHPPKKPSVSRAAHLGEITQPMLFLSGSRDDLADAGLLQEVVQALPKARIHWLETANHSYTVLKRKRRNPLPVFTEMAQQVRSFVDEVI